MRERGPGQFGGVVLLADMRHHDMLQALPLYARQQLRRLRIAEMSPVTPHAPLQHGRVGTARQQLGVVIEFQHQCVAVPVLLADMGGDTAQVGPQLAERLGMPQVTYCEDFGIKNGKVQARRIIEGGHQEVEVKPPVLVTIANCYHPLEYKSFRGAWKVQRLQRDKEALEQIVKTVNLDDVGADPERCGLKGSPTIVAKTEKVGELGGSCTMHEGESPEHMVSEVIGTGSLNEFLAS